MVILGKTVIILAKTVPFARIPTQIRTRINVLSWDEKVAFLVRKVVKLCPGGGKTSPGGGKTVVLEQNVIS